MAAHSKIEWTDATWNPITGCTLVSKGCENCYAAELAASRLKNHPSRQGLARRNAVGIAKFTGTVRFNTEWLTQPLAWKTPRKVFVCAHGDLFHENVPDSWIDQVFAVMALCQQHIFQVLTKRPERMHAYRPISFKDLATPEMEAEELAGRIGGFATQPMHKVGKKTSGRLLDGVQHDGFPAQDLGTPDRCPGQGAA
jgi:protein gp37